MLEPFYPQERVPDTHQIEVPLVGARTWLDVYIRKMSTVISISKYLLMLEGTVESDVWLRCIQHGCPDLLWQSINVIVAWLVNHTCETHSKW